MENHAVRTIHVKLLSLHDDQALFQVTGKEGHRVGLMVDGNEVKMEVSVGDKVLVGKYSGSKIKLDDVDYTIVRQGDILAIVE